MKQCTTDTGAEDPDFDARGEDTFDLVGHFFITKESDGSTPLRHLLTDLLCALRSDVVSFLGVDAECGNSCIKKNIMDVTSLLQRKNGRNGNT